MGEIVGHSVDGCHRRDVRAGRGMGGRVNDGA